MARPSSSKGRSRPSSKGDGGTRKRMRAFTTDTFTPELFPDAPSFSEVEDFTDEECAPQTTPTVSKSWVKFIVGLFLIPFAWVLTETFLQTFAAAFHNGLLANPSAGYFVTGIILFGILFAVIPRHALMIPYVLGHEVTHALWVKLFGGKVANRFHVSEEGGHVLTDRVNTWIALAPYFFPIYSVLVVTLYAAASFATDLSGFRPVLFLFLGATTAFHLVFTCLLIAKGQPDLHYGGTFFSLMVIYLINLIIITSLLLIFDIALAEDAARQHKLHEISWLATLSTFGALFVKNVFEFIDFSIALTDWITAWIQNLIAGFGKG